MKKYVLYGREVDKLIREQRIRIERGDIVIIPLEEEPAVPEVAESVPETTETSTESEETADNPAETVPETESAMDDKNIEIDDLKEVDLDADDKTLVSDDSKDVPAADAKEATPAKKTSKRTKTSE